MPTSFTLNMHRADWLSSPTSRWNKGLLRAGAAWKSQNVHYPPAPTSPFGQNRTKGIARQAKYVVTQEGLVMELYEVEYWKYAMYGVGIYGPYHTPIVPTHAKALAIPIKGASRIAGLGGMTTASGLGRRKGSLIAKPTRDLGLAFYKSVKGYIWEGKLDEIKEALKLAFAAGIREDDAGGEG